jgi:hypothetical protein
MPLEQYYPGDQAFDDFARRTDDRLGLPFEEWSEHSRLIQLCEGDALLARAIYLTNAGGALGYMSTSIPALDDLTPTECLKTDWGKKRLKTCLMRSP